MKKILLLLLIVILNLQIISFAQDEQTEEVNAKISTNLFINAVQNTEFIPYAPFLEIEQKLYMPISVQLLSDMGLVSVKDTNDIYISGDIKEYSQKPSNEKIYKDKNIKLIKTEPINVHININDNEFSTKSEYTTKNLSLRYIELNDELIKHLKWTKLNNDYNETYLFLYKVDDEQKQKLDIEREKLNKLAKYMTIINKKLSLERAKYYIELVEEASAKYNLDNMWVYAMIWQESWYDEKCEYLGARGLMQMLGGTARSLGVNPDDLYDPKININTCTMYLAQDIAHYNGDLKLGIIAYNQGTPRVDRGTYSTRYYDEILEKRNKILNYINK